MHLWNAHKFKRNRFVIQRHTSDVIQSSAEWLCSNTYTTLTCSLARTHARMHVRTHISRVHPHITGHHQILRDFVLSLISVTIIVPRTRSNQRKMSEKKRAMRFDFGSILRCTMYFSIEHDYINVEL